MTPITTIPPADLRAMLSIPETYAIAYTTTSAYINDDLGREVCHGDTLEAVRAAWEAAIG